MGVCFLSSLLLLLSVFVLYVHFFVPVVVGVSFPSSFVVIAVAGDLFIFAAPFVKKRKNHIRK